MAFHSRQSPNGPRCSRRRSRSLRASGAVPTAGRTRGGTGPSRMPVLRRSRSSDPPIIVGGEGTSRGLRIAARHADEFNCSSSGPERVRDRFAALDAACRAIGRDPATIRRSAMVGVLVGRTARELETRRAALAAELGPMPDLEAWLAARAERWIMGDPEQARAMARRYAEAGCERLMLQDFLPRDLDHVKVLAEVLIGRI
ncbi:MAG: hypothetical protein C4343_04925 [Chloroflexota bacterium]